MTAKTLIQNRVRSGSYAALFLALVLGGSALAQQAIPGKIEAESYYLMSGIEKLSTTDTGGGLCVGWMHTGDWMDYNVVVGATSTYTVRWRVASPNGVQRPQLQLRKSDGTALTGLTIAATGDNQFWATQTTTGVPLAAGAQTLRIYVTYRDAAGSGVNLNWLEFVSEASETYTITASAGANGTLAPSGAVTVQPGASPTFTITPAFGYLVGDVLVDSVSVGAVKTYQFTPVTMNHTISASFAVDTTPYTLTVVNGTGDGGYTVGTVVNVVADPPPAGQAFFAWIGDTACLADPNAASTTVTMPQANATITATYMPPGLIAFEPFDYLSGTFFTNGIANGGGGWSGGWYQAANATFKATTAGFTYPGLTPAPLGVAAQNANNQPGMIRALKAPPSNGVFYVSALFNQWYFWRMSIGLKQSFDSRTFARFGLAGAEGGPWRPTAGAGSDFLAENNNQVSGGVATNGVRFLVAKVDLTAKTISVYGDRVAGSLEPASPDASYAFSAWYDSSKSVDQLAVFNPSFSNGGVDEIRVARTWDEAFGFTRPPSGTVIMIR
jgi:hypothetical protein